MGVGVVVRDNSGSIFAALVTIIPFIIDSTVAEAVIAWKAINFYNDLSFYKVIFERDALTLLNAFASRWTLLE